MNANVVPSVGLPEVEAADPAVALEILDHEADQDLLFLGQVEVVRKVRAAQQRRKEVSVAIILISFHCLREA
jgi:hypothetical protein